MYMLQQTYHGPDGESYSRAVENPNVSLNKNEQINKSEHSGFRNEPVEQRKFYILQKAKR